MMGTKGHGRGLPRRGRGWLLTSLALALSARVSLGQTTRTGTTNVTATVNSEASISVSSPTALVQGGGGFVSYTGSTTVTFSVRTTKVGGSGSISLLAVEFAPVGGPTVAGGSLTYTCGGAPSVGAVCSGTQTASTTVSTPVVTSIGANQKANNTTAAVSWALADSPLYSTGAYSSSVTFTVTSL
jgi:hypothetical protein